MQFAKHPINRPYPWTFFFSALLLFLVLPAGTAAAQASIQRGGSASKMLELAKEKLYLETATIQDLEVPQ
jgi:hypothetical protein